MRAARKASKDSKAMARTINRGAGRGGRGGNYGRGRGYGRGRARPYESSTEYRPLYVRVRRPKLQAGPPSGVEW